MITGADIKKMKTVFVTKEDSRNFATKEDLKSFATKEDLKALSARMATKDDLKVLETRMATKDDLKMEVRTLNKKIDLLDNKLDVTLQEVLQFIGETKEDIVGLLSKQINDFRNEIRDINRNSQSTLNNHESRIFHLEYVNKS